ncbi:hypothetical protein ACIHEI_24755 [Kitasatospora sp. NPDC051984]|uniref:hypothetical protein n=1 Tax=Kitasatospora sp. NPDC051984 TaxID=3364059 RepID=UPI0037CB3CB5
MAVAVALALVMAGFTPPTGANAVGIGATACQFDIKQSTDTYGPGVYPTPADDVPFDGTVRLAGGNSVVVVVPSSEVAVQTNWWQKVIATTTGLAVAVLCSAPFAVGALVLRRDASAFYRTSGPSLSRSPMDQSNC